MDAASGTEFVSMPLMAVKEEPVSTDDPAVQLNDSSTMAEPDPMNLLDPVQVCETHDSEATSSERSDHWPSKKLWQSWMAEYPWLLHEDEDDIYGYCLYCNIKLNIKSQKAPSTHDQARNHVENKDNYLAFKESEESANIGSNTVSIKQEFGADSDISAIKYKRMSQTEPLFNFIWRRWQELYPWLERDKDDATYGNCKYCKVRLQVEYSYQRLRHEESNKHRTAVWQHANRDSFSRKSAVSKSERRNNADKTIEDQASEEAESLVNDNQEASEHSSKESDAQEDTENNSEATKSRRKRSLYLKSPWIRLQHNSPQTCQCKICNVKMILSNFGRHLRSKMHIDTEKMYKTSKDSCTKVKQEHEVKARGWKMYAKKHPWLVEDPEEPVYAYCKYCKKRLYLAMHANKRLMHERGLAHRTAVKAYKRKLSATAVKAGNINEEREGKDEESEEEEEEADENEAEDEDNQTEEDEEENNEADEEAESGTDIEENDEDDDNEEADDSAENTNVDYRSFRIKKGSEEWIQRFPWCKKYKDPAFYWCTYCKKALKMTLDRKKHDRGGIHKEAEKNIVSNTSRNLSHFEHSQQDKRIRYYPWLVYTKNNPQYVFCKYCRIRMVAGASRIKHETTKRHKEAAAQLKATDKLKKTPLKAAAEEAPVKLTHSAMLRARSIQTKVAMWKTRFPWLTYKRTEKQPNYGYCKYCEMRVYCPTDKLAGKHQRASKHIRARIQIRRQNMPAPPKESKGVEETGTEKNTDLSSISYPEWIIDIEGDHGFCKYCNVRLFLKQAVLRDRHQSTAKHKNAELEYLKQNRDINADVDASKNMECDTVVVEDDVLSVKSEPMDEDDVLEYLLQRSERTSKNTQDAVDTELTEPIHKRPKLSNPNLMDRAKRLTTAHLELLRLSRDLNDESSRKKRFSLPSSLFNTSAAIAALMSPAQVIPPPQPLPLNARNNIELFFDSVCESVKTLPSDLAAEGKIKIMQLVADLETRALQRNHSMSDLQINSTQSSTPLPSRNTSSPAVSTDVPSTTTNCFDNDSTSPIAAVPLSQSVSSQSLDNGLRIIPINTPQRQSDTTDINSGGVQRRIQVNTSIATDNNMRRVSISPLTQTSKKQIDVSITRVPQPSPTKTITYTKVPQNTQSNIIHIAPSSSSSAAYQRTTQMQQNATSSDNGGVQRIQQVQQQQNQQQQQYQHQQQQYAQQQHLQKTTIIDNGVRRYQINNKPSQPPSTPNEFSFRRIQLPLKGGATITPKSNMPATSKPNQTYSNI